jgi:hypothetical protein
MCIVVVAQTDESYELLEETVLSCPEAAGPRKLLSSLTPLVGNDENEGVGLITTTGNDSIDLTCR